MRKLWSIAVAGLALVVLGACSDDDSAEPLTNDEAVQVLVEQGYTPESAQCLIDGAAQQKVDVPEFLVTGELKENTQVVIDAVGTFCVEEYGGTAIPNTSVP
jgi:hypothetical protein